MHILKNKIGPSMILLAALAAVVFLLAGCEPLHRDIEQGWDGDVGVQPEDVGEQPEDVNDQDEDVGTEEDAGPECEPGLACGPCNQGEVICTAEGNSICEGSLDLQSDIDNCGQCNFACPSNDQEEFASVSCQQGQCLVECVDEDTTYCDGADACIDLQSDRNHCGQCNFSCSGGQVCCEGNCVGQGGGC